MILLLLFSFIYSYQIIRLSNGFMINQYPFISPDGFDWLTEGVWLSKKIGGHTLSNIVLPIARPPSFVVVTALDAFWGQNGVVVAIVLGISMFGVGYLTIKSLGIRPNSFLAVFVLIALLLTPVNFVRNWILSDSLAVFISFLALFYVYKIYEKKQTPINTSLLVLIIAVAGNVQTYALIPVLVGISVLIIRALASGNKKDFLKGLSVLILSLMLYFVFSYAWYRFIPHHNTPSTFSLLELTLAMLPFYINVWGYYFLPFLPLILGLFMVDKKKILKDDFLLSLWLSVFAFMLLAFFYQWKESRFTFIFWPLFVTAIFKTFLTIKNEFDVVKKVLLFISAFMIVFQSFFMVANEWRPDLREISVSPRQTWFARLLLAEPVDRFALNENCGSEHHICNDMIVNFDNYVISTMDVYQKICVNKCCQQ